MDKAEYIWINSYNRIRRFYYYFGEINYENRNHKLNWLTNEKHVNVNIMKSSRLRSSTHLKR